MSASPSMHPAGNNDGERQTTESPYFPRISGANTIARPSPLQASTDEAFPTVKLQAKMAKQTPLPYQTQEFKPCIVLKKFEPSVRVSDSFVPGVPMDEAYMGEFKKKRTVILHTDRYSRHGQLKIGSDSQKVRLAQEGQMLQDARSRMRLREALAHRARHDLHLGGNPLQQQQQEEDPATGDDALASEPTNAKKKRRHRLRKPPRPDHQHGSQQAPLAFIPEDLESRRGGLPPASSASMPTLPLPHQQQQQYQSRGPAQGLSNPSFVSRSEFDALAALIDADQPGGEGSGGGGLDKVKLDGSKVVFNRRSDIMAELNRLKAIVLPDFAKDLYVGRGIRLPGSHGLNNPKKTLTAGDPILEALLQRAQQPARIVDSSGNILIAAGAAGASSSSAAAATGGQRQQQIKQVFAADVTAVPKTAEGQDGERPVPLMQSPPPAAAPEATQEAMADSEPEPPLPEPFLGLPAEWMRADEAASASVNSGEVKEQLSQLQLPTGGVDYLAAILSASTHPRGQSLVLELGRLIAQRMLLIGDNGRDGSANQEQPQQRRSLIGWLRRGLDLFHDVDREGKGSVSVVAFFDILSSMRDLPIDDKEIGQIRDAYGLSGDSVSKLAFLTVLPFLLNVLNRRPC